MEISLLGLMGIGLSAIFLVVIAYYTGHHNGEHLRKDAVQPPQDKNNDIFDPAFILQNMDDGVVIVDNNRIVRLINPAAANITGWQAKEAVGLEVSRILQLLDEHGKPYAEDKRPFLRAVVSSQAVHDNKATLVTRGNRHIPISLVISPISQVTGGGAVGVFRDITREKEEESARLEFISTASHEMRTPIAAIEGYLSLVLNAKNASLDKNSRSFLEKAYQSTKHLGQLFQDLLTSTRAEDSRLESHPEPVNINDLISEVIGEVRPSADKKKLSLNFLAAGETPAGGKVLNPLYFVNVDPERLKEVFRNLLDNSIKYTSAGGVTIKLTGDNSVVQVQISDSGIGIPSDDVPHLFQKFYRVDSSLTRQVGGTGLGLFICKKILELYNGRIWVESQLGKGSTFFVNLPRLSTDQMTTTGKPNSSMLQSVHQA